MARGITLWLAIVVVGSLATLGLNRAWANAMRDVFPGVSTDSLVTERDSLVREAGRTATAIQRIRWSRTLAETDGDTLLVFGSHMRVSDAARQAAGEALARLDPGARVTIAYTTRQWQRPYDSVGYLTFLASNGIDYMLPDDGPCQVVAFVAGGLASEGRLAELGSPGRLLGPCGFVARYGPPSDSVRAWIRNGGGRFAGTTSPSTPGPDSAALAALAPRSDQANGPGRGPNELEKACIAGRTDACAIAIAGGGPSRTDGFMPWNDDTPEPAGLLLYHRGWSSWAFGGVGAHLLADIEAAAGRDRFATFWRTDRPVDAALSDALGRPVGDWVADWAAARFPPQPAGRGVLDALVALLVIAALAGIGLLAGAKGRPITGL